MGSTMRPIARLGALTGRRLGHRVPLKNKRGNLTSPEAYPNGEGLDNSHANHVNLMVMFIPGIFFGNWLLLCRFFWGGEKREMQRGRAVDPYNPWEDEDQTEDPDGPPCAHGLNMVSRQARS